MIGISIQIFFACLCAFAKPAPVEWTMLNVNSSDLQADAHIVRLPSGDPLLIDAGDPVGNLASKLKAMRVTKISQILISHSHTDHYGGIPALLSSGFKIGVVYWNLPPKALCDKERPWGCDYADVQKVRKILASKHIPIRDAKRGDVLYAKGPVKLEVLYAPQARELPAGDINDLSQILRLSVGKTAVLFTGDLNKPLGEYLAQVATDLKADILKVPHHGTESAALNTFLDRVSPAVALVPAPKKLWLSERSQRLRTYFKERKIDTFVNGLQGDITVRLSDGGYRVFPQQESVD